MKLNNTFMKLYFSLTFCCQEIKSAGKFEKLIFVIFIIELITISIIKIKANNTFNIKII